MVKATGFSSFHQMIALALAKVPSDLGKLVETRLKDRDYCDDDRDAEWFVVAAHCGMPRLTSAGIKSRRSVAVVRVVSRHDGPRVRSASYHA